MFEFAIDRHRLLERRYGPTHIPALDWFRSGPRCRSVPAPRRDFSLSLTECQSKYCPLECETIKYDLTLSRLVFPSQTYYDNVLNTQGNSDRFQLIVNQTLTIDSVRSHAVYFNIYYPSLQYTLLTEFPKMSIVDLFSKIGGTLGLVSFSIFTLFELIELFVLFIYGLLIKNKRNIDIQEN